MPLEFLSWPTLSSGNVPMKNKTVLFITFFVVAAAIAVMVAGRESISAVVGDAIHWFH
jgi:hypothetical protein